MVLGSLQVPGKDLSELINNSFVDLIQNYTEDWVEVKIENYLQIVEWMKNDKDIDAAQLSNLTAVDMLDSFEIHVHLQSLDKQKLYSIKVIIDRDAPSIPSLSNLFMGANLQEREVYDLFGITFTDHPDLRRIFLWDGFAGYPLRKDFLQMENANPGLPRFPFEEEGKQER